jgi:hypothetical protein
VVNTRGARGEHRNVLDFEPFRRAFHWGITPGTPSH